MTDYTITAGRSEFYPQPGKDYGGYFVGNKATFCLPADLSSLNASTLAIPGLPITALSANPVKMGEQFFGMSVQQRVNDGLAGITAKVTRSHDLKSGTSMWKYIEVNDNTWNWTNIDSWVNAHYAAGRELVFTLYGTPAWTSARPTELCAYGPSYLGVASEPGDMTKWSRFCTQIATRYLGKIKYYEIWNEPNYQNNGTNTTGSSFYFSGTFTKLAEMVRLAAQAIKGVDPTAKIISPAVTTWSATAGQSAENYFIGMMNAGDGVSGTMKDWVDIVGVHLYLPGNNQVQDLAGMIDRINAAKTAVGVSGKETWDTESAPIGGDMISLSNTQAKLIVGRTLITMAAKGIARTIYYQYDHGTMGIVTRPPIIEYREQIIALLRGGNILNASRFTDGRVAYYTNFGTMII
jgi:hypothetical protein